MLKWKLAGFCTGAILIFLVGLTEVNARQTVVSVSGLIKDKTSGNVLAYVNVGLRKVKDSAFVTGTVTNEEGRFTLLNIIPGNYLLEISGAGYTTRYQHLYVGGLSGFLDVHTIELEPDTHLLGEVIVSARTGDIDNKMDKKTYSMADNISQSGASVLQSLQNLPGITIREGKVQLRGNDKITVLMDGKQTALTGFGNQAGLDNLPASAIEKIEIIHNPSSKFDANGNAGIINIIMKKNKQEGWNGKLGMVTGLGALWIRKENLPDIRPQYRATPKFNPSLSLNYRKKNINAFLQADNLYTHTLNKNEFVTRMYDDGTVVDQQLKRNRNTNFFTAKTGVDWQVNNQNTITVSGLFGTEKIIDKGDQPFFNGDHSERLRLWQFVEDELKTTAMATAAYQHKFKQAGHLLNLGINYTFHREDEKYFFTNIMPAYTGKDSFKLVSDERVMDVNADYVKPLKHGRLETGVKVRWRNIPTDMQFMPGIHSPLDVHAGGWATYKETIPALYGNYIFENEQWEAELGLRMEYVRLRYDVNPDHTTYQSDGYNYMQPFPNIRLGYKINEHNKISAFYNRRVDRPNEVDIRIFPKYDDAEIIKVGNPALRPQFTHSFELGYKTNWSNGYFYSAAYHRFSDGTITRISGVVPGSNFIYAIFQNVGRSYNTGAELVVLQALQPWFTVDVNANIYRNQINAFTVQNLYPVPHQFSAGRQQVVSGNVKLNNKFQFPGKLDILVTAIYLAPDIIAQGRIGSRFSLDIGAKKTIQKGRGELFCNATDLLNTMTIKKKINGNGFAYTSNDYYETQVIRIGYSYKF